MVSVMQSDSEHKANFSPFSLDGPLLESDEEKINILLVDDTPAKLLAHEVLLEELGENIIKASSGRAALEHLLKGEFGVILLDVNMPDMDGFETAALIRQRPKFEHTPILFITGYNTTDIDRVKGYDIGAADYIFLPVIPEVLKAKVRVFVELARKRRIVERQAQALAVQNANQQEQIRTIQDLNEKLIAANEELEAFSYSVSHDLRSPLRAMQGYAQALIEDYTGKLEPRGEDYLRRISRAALRLDMLVQDVLAYTQLSRTETKLVTINLEMLLEEIIRDSRALRQTRASVNVLAPLYPVLAHEACLTQCMTNLLENSAKFVPEGQLPEITVRTERLDTAVRIWIEDNGIGIDPKHHERIFQMFGRVHHVNRYEGTGMGLTIVKRVVERMGGAVGVESQLGNGSKFWINLAAAQS
jgi:two-component system, sensor histidine kinase and response regulator